MARRALALEVLLSLTPAMREGFECTRLCGRVSPQQTPHTHLKAGFATSKVNQLENEWRACWESWWHVVATWHVLAQAGLPHPHLPHPHRSRCNCQAQIGLAFLQRIWFSFALTCFRDMAMMCFVAKPLLCSNSPASQYAREREEAESGTRQRQA